MIPSSRLRIHMGCGESLQSRRWIPRPLQGLGGANAVIVEGDLRGDGVADFQIFVNLITTLGADDFIL